MADTFCYASPQFIDERSPLDALSSSQDFIRVGECLAQAGDGNPHIVVLVEGGAVSCKAQGLAVAAFSALWGMMLQPKPFSKSSTI